MNIFNVYSFINNFDDFLNCAEGIEIIEFSEPPNQFNHWCTESDTEFLSWNCLDCCYIRKYHVCNYYVLIHKDNISLYDSSDCDTNLGIYSAAKFDFVCLLFHFKLDKHGKKCVYISINYIRPINSRFEEKIRQTYFNEKSIRYILDYLVNNEYLTVPYSA
jgi:hypothetical protein